MNNTLHKNSRFKRIVKNKRKQIFSLALLVMFMNLCFIFAMAYRPDWLSKNISPDSVITLGLPLTFVLIMLIYAVMVIFSIWKINDNNADIHQLIDTLKDE